MVTVGITGGIGSGKSTVCELWSTLGGYVLNADALAKELMVTHEGIKKELVSTFGEKSFRADGTLNRAHLAEEAFQKERVDELNAIVHPKLPPVVRRKMQAASQQGFPVGVYEAALLLELETERLAYFDHIVLVLASEKRRLQWVSERDEATEADIRGRMQKQRDFEASTDRADIIIRNNGTLNDLKEKAEKVYKNFLPSGH